jgi:dihydroflavonol-4-reductase
MKAFVTGAGGFIGQALVRRLRERGDEVHALVRSMAQADLLEGLGCQLHEGDLASVDHLREQMAGCDAVFHVAGIYRVGIPASGRPAMYAANVTSTANVLDAATAAGIPRTVAVSTINAFGNTAGRVLAGGNHWNISPTTTRRSISRTSKRRRVRRRELEW